MDRRQFLSLACTLGTVGAAGCSGGGPGTGGEPEPPAAVDGAWPLPEYDPGKTNYTPETTGLSDPVSELWRVETRGDPAVLAVAAETVFAGGGETVRAVDARDGTDRWRASVGSDVAVAGALDTHLVVRGDGEVVALGVDDGVERWRSPVAGVVGTAVTAGGVHTLGLRDGTPTVTALEPADGEQRWQVGLDAGGTEAGVLAGAGQVVVWVAEGTGGWWVLDATTGEIGAERGGGSHFDVPHAYRGGVAYQVDGFYGSLSASGRESSAWSGEVEAYNSTSSGLPVAVGPERLYVHLDAGDSPGLYAVDSTDGERLWRAETGGLGSAAVESERVRLVACEEALLVATPDALRRLDPEDGTETWSVGRGGIDWLGAVDDLVYALHDGDIVALRSG